MAVKPTKGKSSYRVFHFAATLGLLVVLSGCVAFRVAGEVQRGRTELKYGNTEQALHHFQRAAELDADYVLNYSLLAQGIWTYTGRAYYEAGNLSEARRALERARLRHDDDYLAKLYLGLVLARSGEPTEALGEIAAALTGLSNWLEYIGQYHSDGRYWDPGRKIGSEIQRQIDLIEAKDFTWQEVITSAEWLGKELENEMDEVRREKIRERQRRKELHEGFRGWNLGD